MVLTHRGTPTDSVKSNRIHWGFLTMTGLYLSISNRGSKMNGVVKNKGRAKG